jgi:hypothetical protein
VTALHHRSGSASELVATVIAKPITGLRLATHEGDIAAATMRTIDTIGPARFQDVLAGLVFVMEDGVGDVDVHF